MAIRYSFFDTDDLINKYLAGNSIKKLAADNGFSRQVIYRIFRENNVPLRNRSEAMYVRMAQTSPEERQRLSEAAHKAKRGLKNTPEMLHKRALAHKRFIGAFEQEFIDALVNAGIHVIPQEPFMSYNLDIGCGNVAVEIHTQCASPLTSNFIKKLMECVKAGKSMIYVWIPPRKMLVTNECYNKVISLVQEMSTNPPSVCKYWVIKGTGETYATGTFDSD